MEQFTNPYKGLPDADVIRTTFVVSKKDVALLRSFEPREGVLQSTLATLLTKFCHELRTAQSLGHLEQGDYSAYHAAIVGTRLALGGRSSASQSAAGEVPTRPVETDNRDDRRRTKRMARKAKGPQKSDDASGASEGGGSVDGQKSNETEG